MIANLLFFGLFIYLLNGDCYLHWPRGCNNRLNEQSANRNNANRLFDSQNNNRGGYNVCDCDVQDGFTANDWMATATEMYDWRFLYESSEGTAANVLKKQYEEVFFTESVMSTTWTIQHGSNNAKLLSQLILQYTCDTNPRPTPGNNQITETAQSGPRGQIPSNTESCPSRNCQENRRKMRAMGLRVELMNGGNTGTPQDANSFTQAFTQYETNNNNNRGRHESEEYYRYCETRKRNKGLFVADQNPKNDAQKYTRQNPGGTRRGLECPEERDYYPWWNPSPWHDIAIITHDKEYCESTQRTQSQNVADKCMCLRPDWKTADPTTGVGLLPTESNTAANQYYKESMNSTLCASKGGSWECFKWGGGASDYPDCFEGKWSKVNYLGNVDNPQSKIGPKQAHYDWRLPTMNQLEQNHYCWKYSYSIDGTGTNSYVNQGGTTRTFDWGANDDASKTVNCVRMVFRIRYNMSTADYDPYKTDYMQNDRPSQGKISPIQQNPEIDVGVLAQAMQLAINTAQTGRTFQDRTHTFLVCERPGDANNKWLANQVMNVGVRGKRGNIVQTFPATEYDFEPQHIFVAKGQCLHFQWCGSNTHNNGAPGGDGQTGQAGEGQSGTDRHNIVEMLAMDQSYPRTYDKNPQIPSFFDKVTCYHPFQSQTALSAQDAQLVLSTAGFYKNVAYAKRAVNKIRTDGNFAGDGSSAIVHELLNNVSGAFRAGLICCVNENAYNTCTNEEMEFAFLSTRNNNFTNRSQKLKIVIACDDGGKNFIDQSW